MPVFEWDVFRTENPLRFEVLRTSASTLFEDVRKMPKAIMIDQVLTTMWTEFQLGTRTGEYPISKKQFRDTLVSAEVARTTVTINNLWQILQTKRIGDVPLTRREPYTGKVMLNIDATYRWLTEKGHRVERRIPSDTDAYTHTHTQTEEGA